MTKKLFFSIIYFLLLISPLEALGFSSPTDITIKVAEITETIPKETINNWVRFNPEISYSKNYHSEIENINYCEDGRIICALTETTIDGIHNKKVEKLTANRKEITNYLEELSKKVNQAPIDATFSISEGKVSAFSLEKNGRELEIEKNTEKICQALEERQYPTINIELVVLDKEPTMNSKEVDNLGISELIGEGHSNFTGSTSSRIYNIQVAAKKFHGLLIKPGEEFSFVKNLGQVDGEHGFKQELVIKKDKTELDFGGGICQVSTTMFRAAVYSGLKITARKNHAYPVSYYNPQGMDSTVYVPQPDLKFINNTSGYILIQMEIDLAKKQLVFKFYGKNDGRKVEIDGPRITSREPDGSMKAIFTQKVISSGGETILNETFHSSYGSPNDYPHPGQTTKLTEKPKNWSDGEWRDYKKANGM